MKEQRRHTVQCLFNEYQKGHRARDAKKKICQENRSNFMPDSTINYWFWRFKQSDFKLENCFKPYRISPVAVNRLKTLIEADNTRSVRSLAAELRIGHATVRRHLKKFGMEFYRGRWIYSTKIQKDLMTHSKAPVQKIRSPRSSTYTGVSNSSFNWLSESSTDQTNCGWTDVENWELDRYLGPAQNQFYIESFTKKVV